MKTCAKCGATGTALQRNRLATYEDTVLDMPVTLVNAVDKFVCTNCQHSLDVVPNEKGLIAAVALCRVLMPRKLHGKEIRLLRKTMGLKSLDLAKQLAVAPETMSRWENGAEVIGSQAERQLRLLVAVKLQSDAPAIDHDLSDILTMEINPLIPANTESLLLEAVRMKEKAKKETQYDKAEAA
ncbi:MAG TPA: hypothetical protein VG798_03700 [Rhizomicrobium sp.]|nr:hypothetical protein [Rhizomicrobium sp.]